jgi:SnoaL-like domain
MYQAREKFAQVIMILLIVGGAWPYTYAVAQQRDPVSVLKALFEARNAHNAEAAAAFFAEDATIINTNGRKTNGRENIRKIMEGDSAGNAQFVLESPQMMSDKITFTDLTTRDAFRKLEVAPVQIVGEALVQDGKIKSFIVHLPPDSIAKIEAASKTPKGEGVSLGGLPCLDYIPRAKAHAESLRVR